METLILRLKHEEEDMISASNAEREFILPVFDSNGHSFPNDKMPELDLHWYEHMAYNSIKHQKYGIHFKDQLDREDLVRFLRKEATEIVISNGGLNLDAKNILNRGIREVQLRLKLWGMDVNRMAQIEI